MKRGFIVFEDFVDTQLMDHMGFLSSLTGYSRARR
jgi:hypothetical protein